MAGAGAPSASAPEPLGAPLGAPPHIPLRLLPVNVSGWDAGIGVPPPAAGFDCQLGRHAPLGEVSAALTSRLELPARCVNLVYAGRDLDDAKDMADNDITVPGPARRRAGERLEVMFDLARDVARGAARARREEAAAEEGRRAEAERLAARQAKAAAERDMAAAAEEARARWAASSRPEEELDDLVQEHIGRQARPAGGDVGEDQEAPAPPEHVLTACPEAERDAIEALMNHSGASGQGLGRYRVARAYRTRHPTLFRRYDRAKAALQQATINRRAAATSQAMLASGRDFGFFGDFDPAVNEFPLWHGTPSFEKAGGICSSGFDISFVGSTTDSGWYSPGFYFADDVHISHDYASGGTRSVNSKYCGLHVMLLCRALCGNQRRMERLPNDKEKEQLTAACLGPGGAFGPHSDFHSILGGDSERCLEYVCLHRDQVLPEYVILYTS